MSEEKEIEKKKAEDAGEKQVCLKARDSVFFYIFFIEAELS